MKWKHFWVYLLCAGLSVMLFENLLAQDTQQRQGRSRFSWAPEIEIGQKVTDFELVTVDGSTFKLSDKAGKIIIIELGACT
ncbi:hypothetical protein ACFL5L_04475 [candidate division KSB1 bacterium]